MHKMNGGFKPIFSVIIWLVVSIVFFSANKNFKNYSAESDDKCGLLEVEKQLHQIEIKNKLCIAIVGEGIPKQSDIKRKPNIEKDSQGYDMYEGVRAGIETGVIDTSIIEFLYIDDRNNLNCAKRIGEILSKSNAVLCVIGHASSSATLAALPYYKMANIPVLMPIATNPTILKGYETISFRMPNSDAYQAHFISDFVVNEINPADICIVWDENENAKEYSKYLKEKLEKALGPKVKKTLAINSSYKELQPHKKNSKSRIFPENKPDLIIYCGYGELAKRFFTALNIEYSKDSSLWKHKPTAVLVDGCNAPDITLIHSELRFKSYLSFPCEFGIDAVCLKDIIAKHKDAFNSSYSYELFGYDAIQLLASVLKDQRNTKAINRNYVSEELRKGKFTTPTCYQYDFKNGENQFLSYSIYALQDLKMIKKYTGKNIIK